MPTACLKLCSGGCGAKVQRGRCDKCRGQQQRAADAKRGGTNPFYWSTHWRKLRRMKLNQTPLCERCEGVATEVHHRDSNPDNNLMDNLEALCKSCHSRHTMSETNEKRR